MPSEFQSTFGNLDVEFAAGSVFGLRSYSSFMGVLRGAVESWFDSYMEASCNIQDCNPVPNLDPEKCECGIYAYWKSPETIDENSIMAVAEGTGMTLIGTK